MAATDLERLVVQLSADITKYERALNRANGITNRRAREIESRFEKMSSNINRTFSTTLASGVAAIGASLGIGEIARYADAWTEAGNKIAAAAQSSGVSARSLEDLKKGADEARTSFTDYADLYAKLIRSSSNVAKSEQEVANATNIVSKAFKAGGASAQEQAAGILQLGQALGSGVLQGDELRSLRENAPIISQAIADEFKVTIAGLKQLGAEGKLTSDRVFKAILAAQGKIEAQFGKTNATIADSFTKLKNSLTEYVGQQAQAIGLSQTFANISDALSGKIGSIANAAAAAAITIGAIFAGPALVAGAAALLNPFVLLVAAVTGAVYAFSEFRDTVLPLEGSFATLGDYATALWQILKNGSAEAIAAVTTAFNSVTGTIENALSGVGLTTEDIFNGLRTGVNTVINALVKMRDVIAATFQTVPAAIADSVLSAMNALVEGVERGINKVISGVNSAIGAINSLGSFAGVAAIPTLSEAALGRIENSYAGAGERATKAFQDAINREPVDYVGAASDAISGSVESAVDRITAKANEIAEARRELERETNRARGLKNPSENTLGFGGGIDVGDAGGGAGKKKKLNEFEREVKQIREKTDALNAETEAQAKLNPLINDYGYAVAYAKSQQELLSAAKSAGLKVTPELTAQVNKLAEAYAQSSVTAEKLAESQDKIRERQQQLLDLQKDVTRGLVDDLLEGKSAADAFAGALKKIANALLDQAFTAFFNPVSKGGGGGFGGLFKLFGFANGGYTGAGGKYDPAGVVHRGEYVIPKNIVDKIGVKNIEKAFGGYANGGLVNGSLARSSPANMALASQGGGPSVVYSPTIDARGASLEAVERLERMMTRDRQNFSANVLQTVRNARSANVKGF